jgi:hypothetical protein
MTTGFDVHAHKELFKDDEDDHIWIPDIAARGWVIFTSDERISRDPVNVRAVLDSKAQVIMTSDNNKLPEMWGAAFTVGRIRLKELLDGNPGPVYIQLTSTARDHVRQTKQHITHPSFASQTGGVSRRAVDRRVASNPYFENFIKFK